jgi:cytochrome c oxidase cbb3-type subunit 3
MLAGENMIKNYENNLSLFYALSILALFQVFIIVYLYRSISKFKNSDYLKGNTINGSKVLSVMLLIGASLFASSSFALSTSIPGDIQDESMSLYVEKSDVYWLMLINILLLSVIFFLKRRAKKYFRMATNRSASDEAAKSLNKMFDIVPIEQEDKILMEHEYDGIRELDNNLPPWWVWGFYATIAFSVIYILIYHVFGTSDLQIKEYEKSVQKAEIEVKEYLAKNALNIDETNATQLTDPAAIKEGEGIFQANCAVCHNSKGEGNIGPNLTDKNWIYGFDVKDLFGVIKKGTSNGMPEHGSKLNPVQIQKVASFILQLPDAEGKAPQGDKIQ